MKNEEVKVQNEVAKNNELTVEQDGVLSNSEQDQVEEKSNYIIIPDLFIRRKATVKNGKTYNDYTVHGMLRGVPVEVRVRPGKDDSGFTDVSNYTLLNIVFGTQMDCEFAVQSYSRKDFKSNRVISKGLSFFAYCRDKEDGEEYTAPLRFETSSDKSMILKMIAISNKKHSLGLDLM